MSDGTRRLLLAFHQSAGFLDSADHRRVLDWTLAHRGRFKPASLVGDLVDPTQRISETLRDLGSIEALLERRFMEVLPVLLKDCGTRPFEVDKIELELAAHGDGAHFVAHSDTVTGESRRRAREAGRTQHDRILSAVYYFYREPKGFSGGELRLHPLGSFGGEGGHVDIEPLQNSVVAFPSWTRHEVRTVRCPSGAFEDSRFAVNCWFCRTMDDNGGR